MYVWYGTNEYNFEKLVNPPDYAPTTCVGCGTIIRVNQDGYSHGPDGYRCHVCTQKAFAKTIRKGHYKRVNPSSRAFNAPVTLSANQS